MRVAGTSRRLDADAAGWTVGVLVQANHGRRERLLVNGVPVGERLPASEVPLPVRPARPGGPAA
jgi:D-aminopeptidase